MKNQKAVRRKFSITETIQLSLWRHQRVTSFHDFFASNRCQFKKPDVYGALYTLRIQYSM